MKIYDLDQMVLILETKKNKKNKKNNKKTKKQKRRKSKDGVGAL